ncbi:hypothetical protein M9H77_17542 [Catharanthus roseus]|uniref:Uncharacterized protein n=1 Tax=Catharanthus roseus TaxID=4058 RepID=A0ACC0B4Y2_CATRO|nr:hypothetical protein M9H77_17542 [Catharanthus roseus]
MAANARVNDDATSSGTKDNSKQVAEAAGLKIQDMSDERKVRYTVMKLVGQAQIWWSGKEFDLQLAGNYSVTWEEMKLELKRKNLLRYYQQELFDELTNLRQRSMTVIENNQLRDFLLKSGRLQTPENSQPTLEALTRQLQQPTISLIMADRNRSQMTESKRQDANLECFNCGLRGHYAWECLKKKNLHIGVEPNDEQETEEESTEVFCISGCVTRSMPRVQRLMVPGVTPYGSRCDAKGWWGVGLRMGKFVPLSPAPRPIPFLLI